MPDISAEIGARIALAREMRGWTQQQVSVRLKVSRAAVSQWEQGKGVKLANLVAVATLFGVSLDWLAGHKPRHMPETGA